MYTKPRIWIRPADRYTGHQKGGRHNNSNSVRHPWRSPGAVGGSTLHFGRVTGAAKRPYMNDNIFRFLYVVPSTPVNIYTVYLSSPFSLHFADSHTSCFPRRCRKKNRYTIYDTINGEILTNGLHMIAQHCSRLTVHTAGRHTRKNTESYKKGRKKRDIPLRKNNCPRHLLLVAHNTPPPPPILKKNTSELSHLYFSSVTGSSIRS